MKTKELQIGHGLVALVDDTDYDRVSLLKWHAHRTMAGRWYVKHSILVSDGFGRPGQKLLLHRFILNPPPRLMVDHINGDGLDNRRCNLRLCNYSMNSANSRLAKNNTTGYKGVTRFGERFLASCGSRNGKRHIGIYNTVEEAAIAYDEMAVRIFGEFARTNADLGLVDRDDK